MATAQVATRRAGNRPISSDWLAQTKRFLDPNRPDAIFFSPSERALRQYLRYAPTRDRAVLTYDQSLDYSVLEGLKEINLRIGTTREPAQITGFHVEQATISRYTGLLSNDNYTTKTTIDLTAGGRVIRDIPFLTIPLMAGSKYELTAELSEEEMWRQGVCPTDITGYFIIQGSRRTLKNSRHLIYNAPVLEYVKDNNARKAADGTGKIKETNFRKVSFTSLTPKLTKKIIIKHMKDGTILTYFSRETAKEGFDIPAFGVYTIKLGATTTTEMMRKRIMRFVHPAIAQRVQLRLKLALSYYRPESLDTLINEKMKGETPADKRRLFNMYLDDLLFPNMRAAGDSLDRILDMYDSLIAKVLEFAEGHRSEDSKDEYQNISAHNPGELFASLLVSLVRAQIEDNPYEPKKVPNTLQDLASYITGKANDISERFANAFRASWSCPYFTHKDVVAILPTYGLAVNGLSAVSVVNVPAPRKGKQEGVRAVNVTGTGFVALEDTSEGTNCGLLLYLALTARITSNVDYRPVQQIMQVYVSDTQDINNDTAFYLNGRFLGWGAGLVAYKALKQAKRDGSIDESTSIVLKHSAKLLAELHAYTDPGRFVRPLFVVENDKLLFTRDDLNKDFITLREEGKIEYVSPLELMGKYIAFSLSDLETSKKGAISYMEIHPIAITSALASSGPWAADHTPGARRMVSNNCARSSLGSGSSMFDPTNNKTISGAVPLVVTATDDANGFTRSPRTGPQIIVALGAIGKDTLEDPYGISQEIVDQGVFTHERRIEYHAGEVVDLETGQARSVVKLADNPKYQRIFNTPGQRGLQAYHALDEDGVIKVGTEVKTGDILASVVRYTDVTNPQPDSSSTVVTANPVTADLIYDGHEVARVEDVTKETGANNKIIALRIVVRALVAVDTGNKFTSREGQKGVAGPIIPTEEMPIALVTRMLNGKRITQAMRCGIVAAPITTIGRNTMGRILEIIGSMAAAATGRTISGTAFNDIDYERFLDIIQAAGFEYFGGVPVLNPVTGRLLISTVLVGPIAFSALKQTAAGELSIRTGVVRAVDGTPRKGANGGLRIGVMEAQVFKVLGIGVDLMLTSSAQSTIYLCNVCGRAPPSPYGTLSHPQSSCNCVKSNSAARNGAVTVRSSTATVITAAQTAGLDLIFTTQPKPQGIFTHFQ